MIGVGETGLDFHYSKGSKKHQINSLIQHIEIAKEAIKINAKVLRLQLDIKNEDAKKIVEANNIIYIENKCTKIEFEKYFN